MMHSSGINGEGELRRHLADPGSPGKMAVKTKFVCAVNFSILVTDIFQQLIFYNYCYHWMKRLWKALNIVGLLAHEPCLLLQVHVEFKSPASLRALTWSLLKNDFDIDVSIPLDRLIPTVPLRLNYILWLEDIFSSADKPQLLGIDIGKFILLPLSIVSFHCMCCLSFGCSS